MVSKTVLQKILRADRRTVLVVNTRSCAGARLFSRSIELLEGRGIPLQEAHPVERPENLSSIVRGAINRGCNLIIIGGGDGTISSAVDHLAYRDAVLGILPLGTGNAYARTLGIPLDLTGAVEVTTEGRVVDVDLGVANED